MAEIIAQTYELIEKIGSGGGGNVYLAKHLRLNKNVVLKADKRKITTKPELLRREVDVLKDLSHTYIPQVYDFFVIDGTVYTVMDYVVGESLDKPLKRGERFSQAQIVKWAIQLLQALCYLHSPTHGDPPRGFVHSDIKPANIMCKPDGDICLIDFNIALAIGEVSVVGGSAGYASPEHYGLDYSFSGETATRGRTTDLDSDETATLTLTAASSSTSKRTIVPDVRSDVYSLGATLYHLLSGRRPEKNATDVIPLTNQDASPQIVSIINKAMNPNPDLRYQTAEEMLLAFENLHQNDPRRIRLTRLRRIATGILAVCFIFGGILTFVGLKQMEAYQEKARIAAEQAEEAERTEKLALELCNQARDALLSGNKQAAIGCSVEAIELNTIYNARAQYLLTDALGVYDLTDGYKPFLSLTLPSEPIKIALSPSARYAAVLTSGQVSVFALETGEQVAQLAADPSALSDMVFRGDDVLIFAGDGALKAFDLLQGKELWSGKQATSISLSEDGAVVAAVYKDETFATVYDAETGSEIAPVDFNGLHQNIAANNIFQDPQDNLFVLSNDGQKLGVSFSNGALWIFDLQNSDNSIEVYDASQYTHFEGGFYNDQFAFAASGKNASVFAVIDTVRFARLGAFEDTSPYHTYADSNGIYVSSKNTLVKIDANTGAQTEVAYTERDIADFKLSGEYTAVLTVDGKYSLFDKAAKLLETHEDEEKCDFIESTGLYVLTGSMDTQFLRILRLENYSDKQIFSYDITYPHNEARLSTDRKTVMLFSFASFRLYDIESGHIICEEAIPNAEEVYDQQYRRSGQDCWLEVIYNDGTILTYSAVDGQQMDKRQGELPDRTLYEEFQTDSWRITSSLHGSPEIYDLATGELVRALDQDGYLTYVTQVGKNVMTEYLSTDGYRYGILLDENGDEIAKLLNLSDILPDGTVVFDDLRGNLRQSSLYSLTDLLDRTN